MISKITRCWWLLTLPIAALAQVRIDPVPLSPIKSNTGFFIYGADHLAKEIPYSSISGTPFWDEKFLNAAIYLEDGKIYSPVRVRLNLATNNVHFLNNGGEEQIAEPGIIRKIVIQNEDSVGKILTTFRNDIEHIHSRAGFRDVFVEELNQGQVQLLKLTKKLLQEGDSLFSTHKKYSFVSKEAYFLKLNNRIQALKNLNAREILPVLRLNQEEKNWVSTNKINFTKERDLLVVLDYLNTQRH